MGSAWIDGQPVSLEAATAEAARLLGASRLPVIAGLGTDIAGARAAIALGERVGGVIDHMHSDALLRNLDVMRESGMMVTTPNEARLRADLVLLVGGGLVAAWPEMAERLTNAPLSPDAGTAGKRRTLWLCGERREVRQVADPHLRVIGRAAGELPLVLAALRARLAGRPVAKAPTSVKTLDALACELKSAHFGVAVWSATGLDALTLEMLCGVIDDLNTTTRFTGLPLPPPDNGLGVMEACGWLTGFPPRVSFGRDRPDHDPWHFDAARLARSAEADCIVWISAYRAAAPPWADRLPTVALTGADAQFSRPPRVCIAVGHPGIDHDSVEYCAAAGMLGAVTATRRSEAISVAAVLEQIVSALPKPKARPC